MSRKADRHRQILTELSVRPAIRASEIAERLDVHVQTIRRDLDELHEEGKINRTYGGAFPIPMGFEASLAERDQLLVEERSRIAQYAASMIEPGDVVMVDAGSTTTRFARHLAMRGVHVRIITNNWNLVTAVGATSQLSLILCPGVYSHAQGGVSGSETTEFLTNFRADKFVFSGTGVADGGVYEIDPDFAWVKKSMIANAKTRMLLCDHQKFGRAAMTRVCGFDVVDHLITDEASDAALPVEIARAGVRVHMV
ncbi:DeoR/GlpR family DNA-binding transcription regulator [Mesorhizobium sp. PL10]